MGAQFITGLTGSWTDRLRPGGVKVGKKTGGNKKDWLEERSKRKRGGSKGPWKARFSGMKGEITLEEGRP